MERNYTSTVTDSTKELSKKEKISLKDTSTCERLDEATKNGVVKIPVDYIVTLAIHNEKAKDRPDYNQYVIVAKDGTRYVTGSLSFFNAIMDIYEDMEGEDFDIEVYRLPSKNYNGKEFLTCRLV